LLLHLLTNITNLPVTKSVIKVSGMGKAIGSIEKHSLVAGTPNESAIKERVEQIKDAWKASVKVRKTIDPANDPAGEPKSGVKRELESPAPSPSSAKRIKSVVDTKKPSSFSSLLKKVSSSASSSASAKATEAAAAAAAAEEALAASDATEKEANESENKGEFTFGTRNVAGTLDLRFLNRFLYRL
jgi:hypothetical protein